MSCSYRKTALVCLALAHFLWAVRPAPATGEGPSLPAAASITTGGLGRIQRIQGNDVVIHDQLYTLGGSTRYATSRGTTAWKEGFASGDLVLFEFNSRRDVLLLRKLE